MPPHSTSQETVSRLKELLFDRESRELDTLAARLTDLQERVGSDQRLQSSVARVLDGVIRDAEVSHHKDVADAMAPMVLRTLRTELKSLDMQDQIAGLMYPRMGEMVRRYVASAVRDMMEGINRRLEAGLSQNRLALWLRSLASGRSMAELAISETQRLDVEEIYLVRRGSGALIHHWQAGRKGAAPNAVTSDGAPAPGNNRDTLVSGFLAALTSLAEEAFEADSESLRTLDLDDHRIYLRGTPSHLLAVKCSGSAPAAVDQVFDSALLHVLREHHRIEDETRNATGEAADAARHRAHDTLLVDLAQRLAAGASERTAAMTKRHGRSTLKVVLWLIALPLLGLAAWTAYISWLTQDLQARADRVVASIPALAGYPIRAQVERGAQRMWLTGLVPDEASRRQVLARLKALAPSLDVTAEVNVLPKADVEVKLEADSLRRARDRAQPKLALVARHATMTAERLDDAEDREALTGVGEAIQRAGDALLSIEGTGGQRAVTTDLAANLETVRNAANLLAARLGSPAEPPSARPTDALNAIEALVLLAERVSILSVGLEQARSVRPLAERVDAVGDRTTALDRKLDAQADASGKHAAELNRRLALRISQLEERLRSLTPPPPSPRESLRSFLLDHAVFFDNDIAYKDPTVSEAALDALAPLLSAAQSRVRVIGYTDDVGSPARNTALSQARADKVVADLVRRGVPPALMVAVGRPNGSSLARVGGAGSPNRRVEFELAYRDEGSAGP